MNPADLKAEGKGGLRERGLLLVLAAVNREAHACIYVWMHAHRDTHAGTRHTHAHLRAPCHPCSPMPASGKLAVEQDLYPKSTRCCGKLCATWGSKFIRDRSSCGFTWSSWRSAAAWTEPPFLSLLGALVTHKISTPFSSLCLLHQSSLGCLTSGGAGFLRSPSVMY